MTWYCLPLPLHDLSCSWVAFIGRQEGAGDRAVRRSSGERAVHAVPGQAAVPRPLPARARRDPASKAACGLLAGFGCCDPGRVVPLPRCPGWLARDAEEAGEDWSRGACQADRDPDGLAVTGIVVGDVARPAVLLEQAVDEFQAAAGFVV